MPAETPALLFPRAAPLRFLLYCKETSGEGQNLYLEFSLFGRIRKHGAWYIAQCPPLDLSTQGRTAAEARRNLQEASELFLTSCIERGTLDRALRELRFSRARRKIAARPRGSFPVEVTIPLRAGKVA